MKTLKKLLLFFRKIFRTIKIYFISALSYFILFLCGCLFILALGTNISHKAPVLSYWADELHFPYKYSLTGDIEIYEGEELACIPVSINIGGYSTTTVSGEEFKLNFTSSDTENIPIVVSFMLNQRQYNYIEYISFNDVYEVHKNLEYSIGE